MRRPSTTSSFFAFSFVLAGASIMACTTTVTTTGGGSSGNPPAAGCKADTECSGGTCDLATGKCASKPAGSELGTGDGSASSVTFTTVKEIGAAAKPVDLAFNPDRKGEVWVIGYKDNSTHLGQNVDTDSPTWTRYVDPAARHFMHKPPAIAMANANEWGVCGDNDNGHNTPDQIPNYFMGPAIFVTDTAIFAKRTPGGLGSHIDMLHASPFCKGIAHVKDRQYWVFNAYDKALDFYDFHQDHGPGNDDHSDGEIYRYAAGKVKAADDGTPSHLFFDATDNFLYVADTGNARIVKLDTTKGTKGDALPRRNEPLVGNANMDGTDVEEVVPAGTLEKPSGLEVKNGLIYVTDAATSTFYVFDKTGKQIRKLATELPAGSLAGFTFGPDGKIWFTDGVAGRVVRIDTK